MTSFHFHLLIAYDVMRIADSSSLLYAPDVNGEIDLCVRVFSVKQYKIQNNMLVPTYQNEHTKKKREREV